jgi:Transglycosylase SLT domain
MQTPVIKKLLCLTFYSLPLIAFAANFTEPRSHAVSRQSAQHFSLPVKVVIYKSHRTQLGTLARFPADPPKLQSERSTPAQVKAYIQTQATEYGVNPKLALWIVKHESQFNPHAKGDGEASRGLWQISRIYHPEVSDAVAFNVASSTEWSLERIRSGKVNEWSTYRFCRTLYEDCPF